MVKFLINIPNDAGLDFLSSAQNCILWFVSVSAVNCSLRLQLVAPCSYLSICNIGLGAVLKFLEVKICFFMSVRPSVCKK